MNNKIKFIAIVSIILIVSMNITMIIMSIDARQRSLAARQQRTDIQRAIDSFECVLLVPPNERSQQTLIDCHQ